MNSHVTLKPHGRDAALTSAEALAPARGLAALAPWIGLGVVGVAAVLVFWLFEALPFQDLPAHAGLIAMRHRFDGSPFEQQYFVLAPHIGPYSLFRFLGEGFVRVLGPIGAVRALATLPVIATPLALLFARKRLHGEASPVYGFFGVVLSFGLMTLLGFASYLLGVAVMIVGLTLWLDLLAAADSGASTRKKEILVALFAPLIFVAHGHAFMLFLGLTAVSALAAGNRVRRLVRLRALAPAFTLAAYVAWLERAGATPAGSAALPARMTAGFQGADDKLSLLVTPTLMTRTGVDAAVCFVLWIVVIAGAVVTLRAAKKSQTPHVHTRALIACAGFITVLFVALPHAVGWFGFVDGRLVPVILLLLLMAVNDAALGRNLRGMFDKGAPLMAATVTVLALVASYRFQAEAKGYREVLAQVPERARLLNLPLDPNSNIFTAHPFIHYDKLVLAERPALVSDVWFHQGSALYPTPQNPALELPPSYSESDLRVIDWPGYRLDAWDYVLIRTRPQASAPEVPASLTLVDHRGGWWLYRTR